MNFLVKGSMPMTARNTVIEINKIRMMNGLAPVKITKRPCICCKDEFKSEGPQNRMCTSCRQTKEDDILLKVYEPMG